MFLCCGQVSFCMVIGLRVFKFLTYFLRLKIANNAVNMMYAQYETHHCDAAKSRKTGNLLVVNKVYSA